MNQESHDTFSGEELGLESMQRVITNVEQYCACEERRIRLTNEADILAFRAEFSRLLDEERALEDRLGHVAPTGERTIRRRRAVYYWAVTIILTIAGYIFAVLAFDPYRFGWKGYVYSLGLAVVLPFLTEKVIEAWRAERLGKCIAGFACAAGLVSLMLLALIRANLFAESFRASTPAVILEDEPQAPEVHNKFYADTVPLLRLVMVLLALAMDMGAGLALHDAWRTSSDSAEDWTELQNELRVVRGQMTELVYEITTLQNEPAVFAARFWRNFYRAALTHTARSAMTKLLLIPVLILPLLCSHAAAAEQVTIVAAVDLTQSVAGTGPDQRSAFDQNIDGVTRMLQDVPPGCHIAVMGITDQSFAQPYLLLQASVADDPGYFGERLQKARGTMVRTWNERRRKLAPRFPFTDILGAIFLASQTFEQSAGPGQKVLVLFSDMRHHTREVDLESPKAVPDLEKLRKTGKIILPNLKGVDVYVLGVDGTGEDIVYWQSLERFWTQYFKAAGATLKSYTALRNVPILK